MHADVTSQPRVSWEILRSCWFLSNSHVRFTTACSKLSFPLILFVSYKMSILVVTVIQLDLIHWNEYLKPLEGQSQSFHAREERSITEERYAERKLTLDNLNFCVTRSTRHAKFPSQCRRWNFIAKDRENAVRKVKIAFLKKMRCPWKFCSINYCRITVSDHFYSFLLLKVLT
jgi:hypothetical protein